MRFILILFLCLSFISSTGQVSQIKSILQKMYDAQEDLQSARFTLYSSERLKDGKIFHSERLVKLRERPKRIYFYSIKPDPGTQVFWRNGWNENKMYIKPGSFPYVSFSMKPQNALARKDSHHPVSNMGFGYVTTIIKHYQATLGDNFYKNISISDTVEWDKHSCIVLTFQFKDYAEKLYSVKKGEDLIIIGSKLFLSDYSILLANPGLNNFYDVEEGDVIRVPNFYGQKIEFYIDRKTGLPLRQLIYDHHGLYEKYEMKNFIYNPPIKDIEFTPEYYK